MNATKVFQDLISDIQTAGLNFKINLSPFSATISLKNSLIKDRHGRVQIPSTFSSAIQLSEVSKLSAENEELKQINTNLELTVTSLKADLVKANDEVKARTTDEKSKSRTIQDDLILNNHIQEVNRLKNHNENLKDKFKKQTAELRKSFKAEIKDGRRELGEERRQKMKVENKLNEILSKPRLGNSSKEIDSEKVTHSNAPPDVECVICAEPIANYTPKFILGEEINPACNACNCSDHENDENHNPSEDLYVKFEQKVRNDLKTSIRKKLEIRVKNGVICESQVDELEDELIDEMEETVEEQLLAYKERKEYLVQHPSAYH